MPYLAFNTLSSSNIKYSEYSEIAISIYQCFHQFIHIQKEGLLLHHIQITPVAFTVFRYQSLTYVVGTTVGIPIHLSETGDSWALI